MGLRSRMRQHRDCRFHNLAFRPDEDPLAYKLESRLLIVHGCPEEKNCGTYFYEWTGVSLKLLRSN
ncbi:MAG: hypothetical protein LAO79_23835 [Acidobacteriia bacterium]|nr:hypothetical protein [Terriglobia bacterium]